MKISNFEKSAKTSKNLKKHKKKTSFLFSLGCFYAGGTNFIIKKGLFYAKFFEFEEFSIEPFFRSSFQPQHTVLNNCSKKSVRQFTFLCKKEDLKNINRAAPKCVATVLNIQHSDFIIIKSTDAMPRT